MDKGKKRDAFTSKDPNGILINAVVENKKRERKQRLKVSKIALYIIFSN
jgi:hypothetical protein